MLRPSSRKLLCRTEHSSNSCRIGGPSRPTADWPGFSSSWLGAPSNVTSSKRMHYLLLLTGGYNFWVAIPKVRTLAYHALYQSIIGTKILLVLILFGFISAALSSSPASANMQ